MSVPYRNSLVVAFLCIGFITFVTAIKIYQITPETVTANVSASYPKPEIEIPAYSDLPTKISTTTENSIPEKIKEDTGLSNVQPKKIPSNPDDPRITAKAYIVGNVQTGEIYLKYNQDTALPVASMSKLVTAFVATNELPLDKVVEVSKDAASAPPDKSFIKEGEKFTVEELLQPLLLSSSNIAAEALSSSMDRLKFLELMSSYSWEIGMPSTFFADPSGVSPQNVASAKDLLALAKYLYRSRPDILEITHTTGTETATTTEHEAHTFTSTHPFAADPRFIGGKTGRTPEAGDTMLTILKIKDQPVAIVVLGSSYHGREGDTRILAEKIEEKLGKK